MALTDFQHAMSSARRTRLLLLGIVSTWLVQGPAVGQEAAPQTRTPQTTALARLMEGRPPDSLGELKVLQDRIRRLTDKIHPATVAIQVGRANGSGVIVNQQGQVLTAAHVAGRPGREARIYLPSGKKLIGRTMGLNQELDAGLIQITSQDTWPHVELGTSRGVHDGQWCLATGHPGGHVPGRPPVLRWGRVLRAEKSAILTDCTLVGGDSGGPLFDLQGRVIGIHSRIGKNLTINVHVPIDSFKTIWNRLEAGDHWGLIQPPQEETPGLSSAWLGVTEDRNSADARVLRVSEDSPAAQYGIEAGDVILEIDGMSVSDFRDLQNQIAAMPPGRQVEITLMREKIKKIWVTLGQKRVRHSNQ